MKIIVAYAIPEEKIVVSIPNADILYVETGVGKVHAAMRLMRAVCEQHPDMVINVGSAGTSRHKIGDIVVCNTFIDRDLRKVIYDGVISEITFRHDFIDGKGLLVGSCNTGDSFVTQNIDIEGDVIEMEAFAEADVCREMNIPFLAVKYVTDVIGQNTWQDWYAKLADARNGLERFFVENQSVFEKL